MAREAALTAGQVRLWLLIRSYQQADGRGAYPGDEVLAKHMDRSPRSIQKYRRRLRDMGYLRRELRGPKPAYWWAVTPEASQQTANQEPESSETDCDTIPEASQQTADHYKASQKGSQKGSQSASPEYGEYGENNTVGGAEESNASWPAPSDLPSDDGTGHLQYPGEFESVWEVYPRHRGKKAAYRKVRALVRDGADPDHIREAAEKYRIRMEREGRQECHMKLARTFFGPDDWWIEELKEHKESPDRPDGREELAAMQEAASE